MNKTNNYKFNKPEKADNFLTSYQNDNWDMADTVLSKMGNNLGSPADLETESKENLVAAVNELSTNLTVIDITNKITKSSAASAIDIRYAKKCGNLIMISAIVTFSAAPASGTTLFAVADYLPSRADTEPMVTYNGGTYGSALATINTSGVVAIQGSTNYTYNCVKLSYLIG